MDLGAFFGLALEIRRELGKNHLICVENVREFARVLLAPGWIQAYFEANCSSILLDYGLQVFVASGVSISRVEDIPYPEVGIDMVEDSLYAQGQVGQQEGGTLEDRHQDQPLPLVLDLDALERNIKKMGDYAKAHGMRHRVHGKMHKSVDVAKLQVELARLEYELPRLKRMWTHLSRITGEGGYFDTRIVYIAESGPKANRVKRLAVMDQDGANPTVLTEGLDYQVLTPRFSPTQQQITYMALFEDRPGQIYLFNIIFF